MTFVKGVSGNPAGRPIGSRNRKSLICEALLDGDAEGLTRRAIEMALRAARYPGSGPGFSPARRIDTCHCTLI
jgi:hypothetical protein